MGSSSEPGIARWFDGTDWAAWQTWLYQAIAPVVDNHFQAAGLIAERLRQEVSLAERVVVAASLRTALGLLQTFPSLLIVPGDDEVVLSDDFSGMAQFTDQHWLVLVGVRNVRDADYGQAALDEAGLIVTQIIHALQGFAPSPAHGHLRRVPARKLPDYDTGTALIPLQFVTRIYREGSINAES